MFLCPGAMTLNLSLSHSRGADSGIFALCRQQACGRQSRPALRRDTCPAGATSVPLLKIPVIRGLAGMATGP